MNTHKIILHCDANNFFASVEQIFRPELKGKPVAVTGDAKKRNGIVLAKSEEAKRCGVKTGDTIWQAKQKCPNIVCLPSHMHLYEEYSTKLFEIYCDYSDQVEAFSIDECFLDVTKTAKFFGTGEQVANLIRERVKKEIGITISVGVSFCRLFAKLGSDMKKPDAVTCIPEYKYKKMIYPLPIGEVVGIGKRTEQKMNKMGIYQLGDIVKTPDEVLKAHFGINGLNMKNKLLGFEDEPIKYIDEKIIPKSVGNGTTTLIDITDRDNICSVMRLLCEEIATRLRKKQLISNNVSVSVRTNQLEWSGKTKTFNNFTSSAKDIFNYSMTVLDSFWNYSTPIRAIRISCSNLISETSYVQNNFFENIDKKQKFDTAIDKIRSKYGYKTIMPLVTHNDEVISDTALRIDTNPQKKNDN